jgi:hypothetical protein
MLSQACLWIVFHRMNVNLAASAGGGIHIPDALHSAEACCEACGHTSPKWQAFTFNSDSESAAANCWCHPAGEYQPRPKPGYVSGSCEVEQQPVPPGPLVYDNGDDPERAAALAKAAVRTKQKAHCTDILISFLSLASRLLAFHSNDSSSAYCRLLNYGACLHCRRWPLL